MALNYEGGRQEEDQIRKVHVASVHGEAVSRLCYSIRAEFKICMKCFGPAWYHFYL